MITDLDPFPFKNSTERTKKLSKYTEQNLKVLFQEDIWKQYSSQCRDFIEKLLLPSNKRISAEEAEKHIWLTMVFEGRMLSKKKLRKLSKKMTYIANHPAWG